MLLKNWHELADSVNEIAKNKGNRMTERRGERNTYTEKRNHPNYIVTHLFLCRSLLNEGQNSFCCCCYCRRRRCSRLPHISARLADVD